MEAGREGRAGERSERRGAEARRRGEERRRRWLEVSLAHVDARVVRLMPVLALAHELAPPGKSGPAVAIVASFWMVGSCIAAGLAYWMLSASASSPPSFDFDLISMILKMEFMSSFMKNIQHQ